MLSPFQHEYKIALSNLAQRFLDYENLLCRFLCRQEKTETRENLFLVNVSISIKLKFGSVCVRVVLTMNILKLLCN